MSEWVEIKSGEDLPPNYVDVLVALNKEKPYALQVMRHENGWWYGLAKGHHPAMYFRDSILSMRLSDAKKLLTPPAKGE